MPKPPVAAAPLLAIVLVILAGVVLSGMDATAKRLNQLGVPILMVIWGRYFFHTVLTFIAYAASLRSFRFLRARRPGLQLIRAACLFGATCFMYVGLTRMPLADVSSIQFLAPVLVTALSALFLGERVGGRRWIAVGVAFAGVLVVARPGAGVFGWSALLPLGCAILLACYMLLTRVIHSKDDPAATTFYSTAVGAVALSLLVPLDWQPISAELWPLMVLMGAAGGLGHFLWVRAFHVAEASALAPFTYTQVVGAVVWGLIVFGDVPSLWTLVGAGMIVGSGVYVWYRETVARRRAA